MTTNTATNQARRAAALRASIARQDERNRRALTERAERKPTERNESARHAVGE